MHSSGSKLLKDIPWLWLVIGYAVVYSTTLLWLTRTATLFPPDAVDYAEAARSLVRGQGFTINRIVYHTGLFPSVRHMLELHALLQPLLLTPLFAAFGPLPILIRVPSVLFTAGVGVLVFWTARRYFGVFAGLVAAMLIFVQDDLMLLALIGTDDSGFSMLALASLTTFVIAVETGQRRYFVAAGIGAALTTLEKYSGMILPAVFTAVVILLPRARRATGLGNWLWLVAPVVPVAVIHAARNYFATGTFGSSYGGLEWLGKGNMAAYFAYYPTPPSTSDAWAKLGSARIIELIQAQLKNFVMELRADPLLAISVVSPALLVRKSRALALTALFFTLGLTTLVCVVHHVEARYLSCLLAFGAIGLGGLAGTLANLLLERAGGARMLLTRLGVALSVLLFVWLARAEYAYARGLASNVQNNACTDAARYLSAQTDENTPVLTGNSWYIAWLAGRAGVNAPTNGNEALLTVIRHYDIHWAFTGAEVFGGLQIEPALNQPGIRELLRPERVYDGTPCDVYKLNWVASP